MQQSAFFAFCYRSWVLFRVFFSRRNKKNIYINICRFNEWRPCSAFTLWNSYIFTIGIYIYSDILLLPLFLHQTGNYLNLSSLISAYCSIAATSTSNMPIFYTYSFSLSFYLAWAPFKINGHFFILCLYAANLLSSIRKSLFSHVINFFICSLFDSVVVDCSFVILNQMARAFYVHLVCVQLCFPCIRHKSV